MPYKFKNFIRKILNLIHVNPGFFKALILKPPIIHNGPKVRRWPWPRRRHFDLREKKAVIRLLDKEIHDGGAIIYGGVQERAYCDAFSKFLGGGYADAVNSGTNALYIAIRALDLEPGSEVVVPPVTDAGGMMPVVLTNCIPIPADSKPGELNTSAEEIEKVLTPKTAAIIIAHIGGYPLDMDAIVELAVTKGIPLIEDCSQAHGAKCKGRTVGTFGNIAVFSTMFSKHHCTGAQGGVVFTKDTMLFARVRQLADRGKTLGAFGAGHNLIASLNFNQDEISMAIGRVQLDKLPKLIKRRREFAGMVIAGLENVEGVTVIGDPPNSESAYFFIMIRLERSQVSCSLEEFATALSEEGIGGVYAGYPFYPTDMPWYRDAVVYGTSGLPWSLLGTLQKPTPFGLPNVHQANQDIIRVDIHEFLKSRDAVDLVRAIRKILVYFSCKMAS